jgi:tRNA(Ile)-lysidine synthase
MDTWRSAQARFAAAMARFAPFERAPHLAVAVSGGADSTALTRLADDWARQRGGRATGLIVDHGLRAGSAAEAMEVAQRLDGRGIGAVVLPWRGPKPASAVQERARRARYTLLADGCRARGILHLLLGHHAADQAETVAMRAARGSGPHGLAGMPAVAERRGHRILRPLLDWRPDELRALLRELDEPWVEDPSNRDPRFARTRLRSASVMPPVGAVPDRAAEDEAVADWLARHARIDPAGFVRLDRVGLGAAAAVAGMRRILRAVGGLAYPPAERAAARLVADLRAGARSGTLARCRVQAAREIVIVHDPDRRPTPRLLEPGMEVGFDGRFRVVCAGPTDLRVGALGHADTRRLVLDGPGRPALPATVRPTLPTLFRVDRPVAVPHLSLVDGEIRDSLSCRVSFAPSEPLVAAAYAAAALSMDGEGLCWSDRAGMVARVVAHEAV